MTITHTVGKAVLELFFIPTHGRYIFLDKSIFPTTCITMLMNRIAFTFYWSAYSTVHIRCSNHTAILCLQSKLCTPIVQWRTPFMVYYMYKWLHVISASLTDPLHRQEAGYLRTGLPPSVRYTHTFSRNYSILLLKWCEGQTQVIHSTSPLPSISM